MSENYKGIILAAGKGTRLSPVTLGSSKQLLQIYDKPMIYYPLSILMLSRIREILIITNPDDQYNFQRLLGDGSEFGISIEYEAQIKPRGIADAFLVAEEFIKGRNVCLILGDNLFHGSGLTEGLINSKKNKGSTIFTIEVDDPERFGVIEYDDEGKLKEIIEKPQNPKSNEAVTGLYFYDSKVLNFAKKLQPSSRGELEITDLNNIYIKLNEMRVQNFGRGFTWLDTGTADSLLEASNHVKSVQNNSSYMIGSPHEVAFNNDWITKKDLELLSNKFPNTYGTYLQKLID